MNFRSDNEAPAAPQILAALAEANAGAAHAYGEDDWSAKLDVAFGELFECDVAVFPLATGTAANALAVAQLCPPYGAVYCHGHAHLNTDECGAPEFFSAGAKLVAVAGEAARIDVAAFERTLAHAGELGVHECKPSALSLTQQTELGTCYSVEHVRTLAGIAHDYGLGVHMDGARFANGVAHLGCSPADLTWRAGVDMLSFGATKNGALMAEALLVFDRKRADGLDFRRKRAAHLLSKQRFVSAQLLAYLRDDLWLKLAGRSNAAAQQLVAGLTGVPGTEILYEVQGNEVFVRLEDAVQARLAAAGFEFYRWPATRDVYRLVMPFNVDPAHVDTFVRTAGAAD